MEINTQTVKFIGFLNMLAEKSENGIHPISTATAQDKDGLLYDDERPIEIGEPIFLNDNDNDDDDILADSSYPLVADCLIDREHRDIISTWTQDYAVDGINVVVMAGDGAPWVSVTSDKDDDFSIVVENGIWYNT
jgi:hypothetical protein